MEEHEYLFQSSSLLTGFILKCTSPPLQNVVVDELGEGGPPKQEATAFPGRNWERPARSSRHSLGTVDGT